MYRIICLLAIIGISCNTKRNNILLDEKLIKWESAFIMEDGASATQFYTEHEKFIKPYFKTLYRKDTLIVSSLMEVNSCGESIGLIKISNDTLFLLAKNITDEKCASVVFKKFTYFISNTENRKYVIISEK